MQLANDGKNARNLSTGIWVCLYFWIVVVAANLPARLALAGYQAQFGFEPIAFTITGLAVDSIDLILLFLLVNMLVAGLVRVVFRKRIATITDALARTIVPTTAVLFAITMLGTIWASEHKIERGLYPTMFEFSNSLDKDFALAGTKVFLLERFRYTPWIATAILTLSSIGIVFRLKRRPIRTGGLLLVSTLGSVVVFGLCFAWHGLSSFVIPSIPGWKTIWSPGRIFISYGVKRQNIRHGSISLFHRLRLPNEMLEPGAEIMGLCPRNVQKLLPEQRTESQGCHPHPLAQPLPTSPPSDKENGPYDFTLSSGLDELSRGLFEGRKGPIRVWLVLLESFRGDDVHALHEAAPREITPFVNSIFEEASTPQSNVIAAKYLLQAGARTSQSLGATFCGLGTIPYGLSAARDLGLLPLRCLPDILKDANFHLAYYYGSNPSYDNMLEFLNYHGFYHLMTGKQFVEEAPFEGWGVLDHAVFMQALADSNKQDAAQSQFNVVMSLTNHFPFQKPTDIPAAVEARVNGAIGSQRVKPDDRARLMSLAYTDWVFERFVTQLRKSKVADHSLVFAVGDHTTPDYFLWRAPNAKPDHRLALTRVPFAAIIPEAFVNASSDPQKVRGLISTLNERLSVTPVSQNDVPLFILHLLMHTEPIQSLAPVLRWHTIGGQRLSQSFRLPDHPEAVSFGIDAVSKLYIADSKANITQLNQEAMPTVDVDIASKQCPTLLPAASVFSAMMRGYGSTCWVTDVIRQNR